MNWMLNKYIYYFLISLVSIGCSNSPYTRLVKTELAKDVRHDSLFFNLKINDTKKVFLDKCWKLNQDKIVTGDPKYVHYRIHNKEKTGSDIKLFFYGIFDEEKIMTGLDIKFKYISWAPWNENLTATKLLPHAVAYLENYFEGNTFIKIFFDDINKDVFVKIDGNRQIRLWVDKDDVNVIGKIEDLTAKEKYKSYAE